MSGVSNSFGPSYFETALVRILNSCSLLEVFYCSWKFVRNVGTEQFNDPDQSCFLAYNFLDLRNNSTTKFKIQAQAKSSKQCKFTRYCFLENF